MATLGEAIGNAALKPAQAKLEVRKYEKAEAAKERLKTAAGNSKVIRDKDLAAAYIDSGENIPGELFVTQKTGGGGGIGGQIAWMKMLIKQKWAEVFAKYGHMMSDPVAMAKLDPAIRSNIYELAALTGNQKSLTTFDQAYSNLSTLAGGDFMGKKKMAEASKEVGAVVKEVLIPTLLESGYSEEEVNNIVNNKALLLDATRKIVLDGSTDVADQALESFYSLGGEKAAKQESEFNRMLGTLDSQKLANISLSPGLTKEKRNMAAGMAVLKARQEELGAKATESSYEMNSQFLSIADSIDQVIRHNSKDLKPLKERFEINKGAFKEKKAKEKADKIRGNDVSASPNKIPDGVTGYNPPTKDQYDNLGYKDAEEEQPDYLLPE